MENSNTYQLTCCHCGEFISLCNLSSNQNIVADSTLGDIKISNVYSGYGTTGSYKSMDVELTCPRCHYTFKSTVSKNSHIY